MFYTHNIFDFEDPDQPIKTRFAKRSIPNKASLLSYDLTLHNLELTDDIFSPFKSSEEISYLTLTETDINEETGTGKVFRFALSNDIVTEKRTRYSIWDLLGDVGGFNDGLILVC